MCGYCEPGFIMAIAALLQASPSPSEEQIAALAEHLPLRRLSAHPQGDCARRAEPRRLLSALRSQRPTENLNIRLRNGSAAAHLKRRNSAVRNVRKVTVMRKLIISLLLAGAAATPALADPRTATTDDSEQCPRRAPAGARGAPAARRASVRAQGTPNANAAPGRGSEPTAAAQRLPADGRSTRRTAQAFQRRAASSMLAAREQRRFAGHRHMSRAARRAAAGRRPVAALSPTRDRAERDAQPRPRRCVSGTSAIAAARSRRWSPVTVAVARATGAAAGTATGATTAATTGATIATATARSSTSASTTIRSAGVISRSTSAGGCGRIYYRQQLLDQRSVAVPPALCAAGDAVGALLERRAARRHVHRRSRRRDPQLLLVERHHR